MNRLKFLAFAIAALSLTWSCTSDDDDNDPVTNGDLEIDIQNLPDPGADYTYYAWLVGETGVNLKLGEMGPITDSTFSMSWTINDLDFLANAERFLVTVEFANDEPIGPSAYQIADAEFGVTGNNSGDFTSSPMRSSLDDFSGSTGLYFLGTPTTSTMSEETSGIWFGDYNMGSPITSLNLPVLNTGWTYQGWIKIDDDLFLRTGKFYDAAQADLESPFSGPLNGYDLPGEDFNQNLPMMGTPPDLTNREVIITVQPDTMSDEFFPMEIFRNTITVAPATNDILDNVHNAIGGQAVRR